MRRHVKGLHRGIVATSLSAPLMPSSAVVLLFQPAANRVGLTTLPIRVSSTSSVAKLLGQFPVCRRVILRQLQLWPQPGRRRTAPCTIHCIVERAGPEHGADVAGVADVMITRIARSRRATPQCQPLAGAS